MRNINASVMVAGECFLMTAAMSPGCGLIGSMMTSSGTENIGSDGEMFFFGNKPLPPKEDFLTQRWDTSAP